MKTLDPIGLFQYLNPRASGLIVFKGGNDGASAAEVETIVDEKTAPIVDAGNAIASNIGTASETGTTTAGSGSFTTPVTNQLNADGEVVQVGGETVNYGGGEVDVTDTVKGDTEKLIGGQSETYLINALKAYRSGDRTHPGMRAIATTLSDQDIFDLAAYYSSNKRN